MSSVCWQGLFSARTTQTIDRIVAVATQILQVSHSLPSLVVTVLLLHFTSVVHDAKCIVVTRVCVSTAYVSVRGCMRKLLYGPGCNLEEWYRGCPCALLGRFAIGARVALLWQHNANPSYKLVSISPHDNINQSINNQWLVCLNSWQTATVEYNTQHET